MMVGLRAYEEDDGAMEGSRRMGDSVCSVRVSMKGRTVEEDSYEGIGCGNMKKRIKGYIDILPRFLK